MLQSKEQIGKLDRQITIQYKDVGENVSNEDAETGWITFLVPWARVDEKSGGEYYRDDKLTAVTVADFYIRYTGGINEAMRIVYNGRLYNIKAIIFLDRKRFMKLTAESGGEYVELET
jgi:SPP1 family predicted phage head-tail adaptor